MDDVTKFLNEQLRNPDFKKEWDALEPEYQVVKTLLNARHESHMTQKQLAKEGGVTQADISRIEKGSLNVSVNYSDP